MGKRAVTMATKSRCPFLSAISSIPRTVNGGSVSPSTAVAIQRSRRQAQTCWHDYMLQATSLDVGSTTAIPREPPTVRFHACRAVCSRHRTRTHRPRRRRPWPWPSPKASPKPTTEPSPSRPEPPAGSASRCNYPLRHRILAHDDQGDCSTPRGEESRPVDQRVMQRECHRLLIRQVIRRRRRSRTSPALTSVTRWAELMAGQQCCADSMSLNAIAIPAAREPGPLVTRCRSRRVAKVDSIGLVVRRWIQCSPGKS